jgi:U-box domain
MEVPPEFVCPITMEIMVHPVATRYGQNFERSAIVAWLDKGSGECPLTRRPLRMKDLINNNHLTKKIRQWKELHDLTSSYDDSDGVEQVPEEDEVLILMYGSAANRLKLSVATKAATATPNPRRHRPCPWPKVSYWHASPSRSIQTAHIATKNGEAK